MFLKRNSTSSFPILACPATETAILREVLFGASLPSARPHHGQGTLTVPFPHMHLPPDSATSEHISGGEAFGAEVRTDPHQDLGSLSHSQRFLQMCDFSRTANREKREGHQSQQPNHNFSLAVSLPLSPPRLTQRKTSMSTVGVFGILHQRHSPAFPTPASVARTHAADLTMAISAA